MRGNSGAPNEARGTATLIGSALTIDVPHGPTRPVQPKGVEITGIECTSGFHNATAW